VWKCSSTDYPTLSNHRFPHVPNRDANWPQLAAEGSALTWIDEPDAEEEKPSREGGGEDFGSDDDVDPTTWGEEGERKKGKPTPTATAAPGGEGSVGSA